MMSEDKKEWDETLDLLIGGNETVISELSIGSFVTVPSKLFDNMVEEINDGRIKNGNLVDGVELIMVRENEEIIDGDSED